MRAVVAFLFLCASLICGACGILPPYRPALSLAPTAPIAAASTDPSSAPSAVSSIVDEPIASDAPTALPEPSVDLTPAPLASPGGDLPFIGAWNVTGYRIGADGARALYEGGGLKGYVLEFNPDGSAVTHTNGGRDIPSEWSLDAGRIKLVEMGATRVIPYRMTESGAFLMGNSDGSWTELTRAN